MEQLLTKDYEDAKNIIGHKLIHNGVQIFNLSTQYPIVYGISSIFLALVAGVAVSFIRRQVSKWKAQQSNKPTTKQTYKI